MKFRLEFDMDNAAFQDALGNWEIANVLHRLAGQVQSDNRSVSRLDGWSWLLRDSNGNRVGTARVVDEEAGRKFTPDGRCITCGEEAFVIGDKMVCPGCDYECFFCGNATLTGIGEPTVRCGTCEADYDLPFNDPCHQDNAASNWVAIARRDLAEANDPPEARAAKLEGRIFGEDFVKRDLLDGKER